jgi:hypothetical protein
MFRVVNRDCERVSKNRLSFLKANFMLFKISGDFIFVLFKI